MTRTARLYGGSLYDLAAEEKLTGVILEEMQEIRKIFREMPEYLHLLGEPSIPKGERTELIENAFRYTGRALSGEFFKTAVR